jgi:AcrR family transcriptional regulator
MAYRRTPAIDRRLADDRERLLDAASARVAQGGWAALTITDLARDAEMATGRVYTHVAGKDELCTEVFRRAADRELGRVAAAARAGADDHGHPVPTSERITAALRTFAARALAGRRLAYALLAEPAGQAVEAERLRYRAGYHELFAAVLREGLARGELGPCRVDVVAAALIGAAGEALVGPLAPAAATDDDTEVVEALLACCQRMLPTST